MINNELPIIRSSEPEEIRIAEIAISGAVRKAIFYCEIDRIPPDETIMVHDMINPDKSYQFIVELDKWGDNELKFIGCVLG